MQCAYENASTVVCSVIHNVVEQVLLYLIPKDVIGENLNKHISTYFNSDDATSKICVKPLSINSFMDPIAASMQSSTSKPINAQRPATKMEEKMNALIPNQALKQATSKSVSPPSSTDLARSLPQPDKDEDWKFDRLEFI